MEDLAILFNSLIMSVFRSVYHRSIRPCAYRDKYIKRMDKCCRGAVRFGFTKSIFSIKT